MTSADQPPAPIDQWRAVDSYFIDLLVAQDEGLLAARAAGENGEVPAIEVAPNQGKLLSLLAMATGAKRVLELGTLAGYSTIWLARGVGADGRVVTCEFEPRHAEIAAANIAKAGLSDRVEIRIGPAADSLQAMIAHHTVPFDLIFIDADKPNYPQYLELCLELSRPGTLIIADNVVRRGRVADPDDTDPMVRGVRAFLDAAAASDRLDTTVIQTVGTKGWDGLSLSIVR